MLKIFSNYYNKISVLKNYYQINLNIFQNLIFIFKSNIKLFQKHYYMDPVEILNNCEKKFNELEYFKSEFGTLEFKNLEFRSMSNNFKNFNSEFEEYQFEKYLKMKELFLILTKDTVIEKFIFQKFFEIFISNDIINSIGKNSNKLAHNEIFIEYLKILYLIEYIKRLYLNIDKNILKFIFCFNLCNSKQNYNKNVIKILFEKIFFKIKYYEERYVNFILNEIYYIFNILLDENLNYLNIDYLKMVDLYYSDKIGKKMLKFHNMVEMGPLFYLTELICEDKIEQSIILYPLIKNITGYNDENIYINIIFLLLSNKLDDIKIIKKIVHFFKTQTKIKKEDFNNLLSNSKQNIIKYNKCYFKFSIFGCYTFDPLNKKYSQNNRNILIINPVNTIIYNYFCLLHEIFDNIIINNNILHNKNFVKNISKYEEKLFENIYFKEYFELYKINKLKFE